MEIIGQIGNYNLHRLIGEGYHGDVYLATKRGDGRFYALKVLNPDVDIWGSLQIEARLLYQILHPYILGCCDFRKKSPSYIVTHYAIDGNMTIAFGTRIPIHTVLFLVKQITFALDEIHRHGIVHRDIKPENLFRFGDVVKISDFGLARLETSSLADEIIGSAEYMAPEQWDCEIRRSIDLYALAIIVYEWLVGWTPFRSASAKEMRRMHKEAAVPSIAQYVGREIDGVLQKALAKNVEERYPNGNEFAKALQLAFAREHSNTLRSAW